MPKTKQSEVNTMQKFKVYITETVVRPVWVAAETPAEAERIAEENYNNSDVSAVTFEADPVSRRDD
jgi:hypothetical protein